MNTAVNILLALMFGSLMWSTLNNMSRSKNARLQTRSKKNINGGNK